jgi:predicted RNA-binding Zn-ribbon protein involved in translation (DUF1610 family)
MTHDTPSDTADRYRWCANCQLEVEPSAGNSGPVCPSCGSEFGD